jgi:hypothetical protein
MSFAQCYIDSGKSFANIILQQIFISEVDCSDTKEVEAKSEFLD